VTEPNAGHGLPSPEFRLDSGALRFWVAIPGQKPMGACVSASVLHYRFKGKLDGSDASLVYDANRAAIDAAVIRRAKAGSREPVMLRESDLHQRDLA